MASSPAKGDAAPTIVATAGGEVTLLDRAALQARANALQGDADKAAEEAKSLRALAEDLWVELGKMAVARRDQQSGAAEIREMIERAAALNDRVVADDSKLESVHGREHTGISGLAGKVKGWNESRKLTEEREQLQSQLRPLWAQIGRQAELALPASDSFRGRAVAAENQARDLEERAASESAGARSASDELKRRTDSEKEMGFDVPYTAAYFQIYGPPGVESPLILKRGEKACFAALASLARNQTRRQWVGGSQGFSFPIGHTGIRYRVGSFHGHPIEQQSLTKLDSGTLVITNQRIAFVGTTKSTSIPLAKLLHVECYADAVAVFLEGRENPDFYLTARPKYALFMINWFLKEDGNA